MGPWFLLSLLVITGLAALPPSAAAQYPAPRATEAPDALASANRAFDAGRWDEAVESFEAASREPDVALPPDALRRWGLAGFESGHPLTAYVRLRQYLAMDPDAPDRDALVDRVGRARELLLASAARFSRLVASEERRSDEPARADRQVVRIAAREGEVSLEGLVGPDVDAPAWRRADEIKLTPYLDLIRRLLNLPAVIDDVPPGAVDARGTPLRVAVLRLVIGEEERRLEATRGEPYTQLRAAVDAVVEFARRTPGYWAPEPRAPAPAPVKPGKKRR